MDNSRNIFLSVKYLDNYKILNRQYKSQVDKLIENRESSRLIIGIRCAEKSRDNRSTDVLQYFSEKSNKICVSWIF